MLRLDLLSVDLLAKYFPFVDKNLVILVIWRSRNLRTFCMTRVESTWSIFILFLLTLSYFSDFRLRRKDGDVDKTLAVEGNYPN